MITDNWERIVTQTRLTDEPYPRAKIRCTECEQTWDDDDEEKCVCDEDEDEPATQPEPVTKQPKIIDKLNRKTVDAMKKHKEIEVCDEDEEEEEEEELPCAMTLAKAAKEERILDDL